MLLKKLNIIFFFWHFVQAYMNDVGEKKVWYIFDAFRNIFHVSKLEIHPIILIVKKFSSLFES